MTTFNIAQSATFMAEVEIPRAGGEAIKVPFEFQYRDRKALALLFASWQEVIRQDLEKFKAKGDDLSIVDTTDADIDRQIAQVEALVVGWGFDDDFSPESIRALVETSAGAGQAIVDTYQKAFAPARLGN
jgi:hypothetical protein